MITGCVFDRGHRVTTFEVSIQASRPGARNKRNERHANRNAHPSRAEPEQVAVSAGEGGGREQVDQAELSRHLAEIVEKSRRLVTDFLARQGGEGGDGEIGMANPMAIGAAFFEMTARLMSDPSRLVSGADIAVERIRAGCGRTPRRDD